MSESQMQPSVLDEVSIFDAPPAPALEEPKAVEKIDVKKMEAAKPTESKSGLIQLADKVQDALNQKTESLTQQIMKAEMGPEGNGLKDIQDFIMNLGAKEMRDLSSSSNSMTDRPLRAMKEMQEGKGVATSLLELRNIVEELDPNRRRNMWSKSRILKAIPFFGNKFDNYAKEFESSQVQIDKIIESLYSGKDTLEKDNAQIEVERIDMWKKMGQLEQYIYVTQKLAARVEEVLPEIQAQDPYKAKIVREDILFYLKQRHIDLATNMAVNFQGYLSLDVVKKNNVELIKGVDRARNTTVQALKVAVMVSTALANQSQVIKQIEAVNTTTENLIKSNGELLKNQAVAIHKQATSATINPEVINQAFRQVVEALDSIDKYKGEAIVSMDKTISTLTGTITDMKKHMDKTREAAVSNIGDVLNKTDEPTDGIVNLDPTKNKIKL